jgi:hypothetical protein
MAGTRVRNQLTYARVAQIGGRQRYEPSAS